MYRLLTKIRGALLVGLTHHLALPLLRHFRKPLPFPYTRGQLQEFPKGTLGRDLLTLLDSNGLQLLPYYAKHDMKHLVLDYPTTEKGEVCLQAFMFGNGHLSMPVMATLLYGWVTMPEYWPAFMQAYRRGKKSICLENWSWNHLLTQPTFSLQQQLPPLNPSRP